MARKRILPIPLILLIPLVLLVMVIVAGIYRFSLFDDELISVSYLQHGESQVMAEQPDQLNLITIRHSNSHLHMQQ